MHREKARGRRDLLCRGVMTFKGMSEDVNALIGMMNNVHPASRQVIEGQENTVISARPMNMSLRYQYEKCWLLRGTLF